MTDTSSQNLATPNGRRLTRIKPTPDKGLGMFAITPIPAGTTIVEERPLIQGESLDELPVKWGALTKDQQARCLSLAKKSLTPQQRRDTKQKAEEVFKMPLKDVDVWLDIWHIWRTNSWGWEIPGKTTGFKAVFDLASRFNHSCRPNARAVLWRPAGSQAWVVMRDIAVGEEITTSYIGGDIWEPRSVRQERPKAWGFDCACEVCNQNEHEGRKGEIRRTRLTELLAERWAHKLPKYQSEEDRVKYMECLASTIALFEEEGDPLEVPAFCRELAEIAGKYAGNVKKALIYAEKGFGTDTLFYGTADPRSRRWKASVEELRKADAGGCKVADLKLTFLVSCSSRLSNGHFCS